MDPNPGLGTDDQDVFFFGFHELLNLQDSPACRSCRLGAEVVDQPLVLEPQGQAVQAVKSYCRKGKGE